MHNTAHNNKEACGQRVVVLLISSDGLKFYLFQVGPMLVPDKKLVYSLYLDRVLTTPADLLGGANITADASRRTAVVEYNGVVVVAPDRQNLIADEGSVVSDFLH